MPLHVLPIQCVRRPALLSRCGPRWDMQLRAARLCVFERRTRGASKGSKVLRQASAFYISSTGTLHSIHFLPLMALTGVNNWVRLFSPR